MRSALSLKPVNPEDDLREDSSWTPSIVASWYEWETNRAHCSDKTKTKLNSMV
jgi:hypothetical protein